MADAKARIDLIKSHSIEIDIKLVPKRLLAYVAATILVYGAFLVTFYYGIPVRTVHEAIGTSKHSEKLVGAYNTSAGFVMALVEVLVGLYLDKFMPVLEVFVHNALFRLHQMDGHDTLRGKVSRRFHHGLVFSFPIVLMLTMGNGLRSLQAVQSSGGFNRTMQAEDLKKDQPVLEQVKAALQTQPVTGYDSTVDSTILKNAVRQRVTPFTFAADSPCGGVQYDAKTDLIPPSSWTLNGREAASSSAVYGFVPREWNIEALTAEPTLKSTYNLTFRQAVEGPRKNETVAEPADFSMETAYEMLVQAKMVIERAFGNSVSGTYDCSDSDRIVNRTWTDSAGSSSSYYDPDDPYWYFDDWGSEDMDPEPDLVVAATPPLTSGPRTAKLRRRLEETANTTVDDSKNQWTFDAHGVRQCQGGVSAMFRMKGFYNDLAGNFTAAAFIKHAAIAINITIPNLVFEDTKVTLQKLDLTPQIQLETLQIDIVLNNSFGGGSWLQQDCRAGDDDCESLYNFTLIQTSFCGSDSCAFVDLSKKYPVQPEIGVMPYFTNCTLDEIYYSADARGFFPAICTRVDNAAFLYGYGSYITGREYGVNESTNAAYIVEPRRRIQFTFAKATWMTTDLAAMFNVTCADNLNCTGLSYRLQSSGRYLFAGAEALPKRVLEKADYREPIPLVQLNSPTIYVEGGVGLVPLERLAREHFKTVKWPGKAQYNNATLGGSQCSMLVDSYNKHVNANNFFMERPMRAMYTSFFFFLMENAAVTTLKNASAVLPGANGTSSHAFPLDLSNVQLKGDKQERSIHVSIPFGSFLATMMSCVAIFIATIVIIRVPAPRVERFANGETTAEQFVIMRKKKDYPSNIHNKLLIPATGESVRFDDVSIESMVLVRVKDPRRNPAALVGVTKSSVPSGYSQVSQAEDLSQGTSSEEMP